MNIRPIAYGTLAAALTFPQIATAAQLSAWGFPLGVAPEAVRASVGAPMSEKHAANGTLTWQYVRNGIAFYVTFVDGRTKTIDASQQGVPLSLDAVTESPQPDALGIRLGDPVGQVLLKAGAVTALVPHSGVEISMANITATRGSLRYMFNVFMGRVQNEWVTLL